MPLEAAVQVFGAATDHTCPRSTNQRLSGPATPTCRLKRFKNDLGVDGGIIFAFNLKATAAKIDNATVSDPEAEAL